METSKLQQHSAVILEQKEGADGKSSEFHRKLKKSN